MTISDTMREIMFSQETDDGLLVLITIDHETLAQPIRVVNNHENVTSRSNEFIGYPFQITLPGDNPEELGKVKLQIDNVSREIGQAIRAASSPPSGLVEVVRLKAPDELEQNLPSLTLRNVRADKGKVTGDLTYEDLQVEPYPYITFNPAYFPGLF